MYEPQLKQCIGFDLNSGFHTLALIRVRRQNLSLVRATSYRIAGTLRQTHKEAGPEYNQGPRRKFRKSSELLLAYQLQSAIRQTHGKYMALVDTERRGVFCTDGRDLRTGDAISVAGR